MHIYIHIWQYTHQYIHQYICQCYRLKGSQQRGGAAEGRAPPLLGGGRRPPPLLVYSIGICIGICIGVYICIYVYEHGYAHHSMGEDFSPHAMVAGGHLTPAWYYIKTSISFPGCSFLGNPPRKLYASFYMSPMPSEKRGRSAQKADIKRKEWISV